MCLYPKLLRNKKYLSNKKNGGVIPTVKDYRTLHIAAGCGKCKECRKAYARNWLVRLIEDIKENKNGKFVTLTFNNTSLQELINEKIEWKDRKTGELKSEIIKNLKGYEIDNAIATLATRRFLERWRKEHGKSVRHWLVTELGHKNTEHVHLHGIIWTDESVNEIEKHWKYGFVWKGEIRKGKLVNYVNECTAAYITKYISKVDFIHKQYKSKVLTSKGIGSNYIRYKVTGHTIEEWIWKHPKSGKWHLRKFIKEIKEPILSGNWTKNKFKLSQTDETYLTRTGHKVSLPIYWRNKIYTEEERELLWIEKLNKETRWINGIKIDISKGDEQYYKLLKIAQEQNEQLGYGNDKSNWKREYYEQKRREAIYNYRTKAGQPPAGY